jgi:sugar phosphate isomerase/epimerase
MHMNRREFPVGSALVAGSASRISGQTPDKAKLDRIAILTLNFDRILKSPAHPNDPQRTLDIMDVPDMFAEHYGVHYVEVFCTHFLSTERAWFTEFSERVKKAKSKINQISLGGLQIVSMSSPDPVVRLETIDLTKQWIDHAVELGCPRVMVNQGTLDADVREEAIKALKAMADYGRSKNVAVTLETRGGALGWEVLVDAIKRAGAYANPDCGNFPTEEARHAGLRAMYPLSSGSSHVHYAPERWSLPDAIAISKEVGYKGIYALEGSGPDPYATTQTILDALLPLI